MANAVDLAGAIGTWVAVFLAIVALLGLLPAYILYRRSRTEKAQALSVVDDPSHMFTSTMRIFGAVVRYSARVPDLRYSPDVRALEGTYLSGTSRDMGFRKSSTSWIEFAFVMKTAFPRVSFASADLLVFEHRQSYLPVSAAWLLALGLLHRVAIRLDHGLPLDADVETSSPTTLPEPRLSGVSGYLDHIERERFGSESHYISFEMHQPFKQQPPARRDHLSLRTLHLLFKGYVEAGAGILFDGRLYTESFSRAPGRKAIRAIASTKKKNLSSGLHVVRGVIVQATTKMILSLQFRDVEETLKDVVAGREYYELGCWPISRRERLREGAAWDIWMRRKEVHRLAFVYLQIKPSSHGFVFDGKRGIVIDLILGYKTVGKLLGLAKAWLPRLGLVKEQQVLASLEVISTFDLINISWSRRLMQEIASFDDNIDAVLKDQGTMWEFIRTMHACDDKFQESVEEYMERVHAGDQGPKVALDVGRGVMGIPQAGSSQQEKVEFEIDFEYTLAGTKPRQSLGDAEIDPAHVVLACLQGQLRSVAWNMALSPKGLLDIMPYYSGNDGTFLVSSNTFRSVPHSRRSESEVSSSFSASRDSRASSPSSSSSARSRTSSHFWPTRLPSLPGHPGRQRSPSVHSRATY